MRVYVSVDMEGIAGVVHEDQTNPVDPRCAAEYARFCKLMTGEANAAVEGALSAGATYVVVNDSHRTTGPTVHKRPRQGYFRESQRERKGQLRPETDP